MDPLTIGDTRLPPRFWTKVEANAGGCWLWIASLDSKGYGHVWWNGRTRGACRVAYEILVADVPIGLDLDHLCRVRNCVNPAHLEPVTRQVNVLRGVGPSAVHAQALRCPSGHPYDEANTYRWRGWRMCRACSAARSRARAKKKREAA